MKRYPGATWKPLGKQGEPAMTAHNLVIVHTMVGYMYSTDVMFRQGGYSGTESHFGIGGKWGSDGTRNLDGVVWQWQGGGYQADANLQANATALSIETADNAPAKASDIEKWTSKQVEALARLIAWLCSIEAHADCPSTWQCNKTGIPLSLVVDSKPGRRGVAYHRQGIDPCRVSGGQQWSTAFGKECPGPRRIAQLEDEVLPLARRFATMARSLSKEDVVAVWVSGDSDVIEHEALDKDASGTYPPLNPDNPNWRPGPTIAETNRVARQNRRSLVKVEAGIGDIVADLAEILTALGEVRARLGALEAAVGAVDVAAIRTAVQDAAARAGAEVDAAGARVAEDLGRYRLSRDE